MNHQIVARAMCKVTEEILWKPRMGWAMKHNPTAALEIRVGSGKKTCLTHKRDITHDASMTLTYGVKMIQSKCDPDKLPIWLSSKEVHKRGYYGGELTLLNVLAHTIAHEFGHFVQVILGLRYDGSVHNKGFYTILDRIHASGEADKIRRALHEHCMRYNLDLTAIRASQAGIDRLENKTPNALTLRDVHKGQELWFADPAMRAHGPVLVVSKLRKRIKVESVLKPGTGWTGNPSAFVIPKPDR